MEVLKSDIVLSKDKGTIVEGTVLVKEYSIKKTKTGKDYIDGTLQIGGVVKFKIWSGATCSAFISEDYSGCVCEIRGEVDEYQGVKSIIISECRAVEGFSNSQFMEVRYNKEGYWNSFRSVLDSNLSDKGKNFMEEMLYKDTALVERFKEEFCAKSHHDNCLSGLLAHSYKMLCILHYILPSYPDIIELEGENSADRKDLLFIGVALHDIGKTKEMEFGVYQPNSGVSHRFFGAEWLAQNKEFIVRQYDEKWYYDLVSVMLQHHGEYGDPCRTWASYIVHNIDLFESRLQGFCQIKAENTVENNSGKSIWVDNNNLTL